MPDSPNIREEDRKIQREFDHIAKKHGVDSALINLVIPSLFTSYLKCREFVPEKFRMPLAKSIWESIDEIILFGDPNINREGFEYYLDQYLLDDHEWEMIETTSNPDANKVLFKEELERAYRLFRRSEQDIEFDRLVLLINSISTIGFNNTVLFCVIGDTRQFRRNMEQRRNRRPASHFSNAIPLPLSFLYNPHWQKEIFEIIFDYLENSESLEKFCKLRSVLKTESGNKNISYSEFFEPHLLEDIVWSLPIDTSDTCAAALNSLLSHQNPELRVQVIRRMAHELPGQHDKLRPLVSIELIDSEENLEVRRALMDCYGQGRFIHDTASEIVHEDSYGILYRRSDGPREPMMSVKVTNSTAEADGTFKCYFLRVPPTIKTAHEAVAWTFNMTPSEYNPLQET